MAGSLGIRNVGDALIVRLKRRAARHGQSAEVEMRDILRQVLGGEAETDLEHLAAELRRLTAGDLVPMRRLLEPATRLATVLDHPAYDCIYLSLAQSTGCSFVTADTRFCARVQDHTLPDQVPDLAGVLDRLDAKSGQ